MINVPLCLQGILILLTVFFPLYLTIKWKQICRGGGGLWIVHHQLPGAAWLMGIQRREGLDWKAHLWARLISPWIQPGSSDASPGCWGSGGFSWVWFFLRGYEKPWKHRPVRARSGGSGTPALAPHLCAGRCWRPRAPPAPGRGGCRGSRLAGGRRWRCRSRCGAARAGRRRGRAGRSGWSCRAAPRCSTARARPARPSSTAAARWGSAPAPRPRPAGTTHLLSVPAPRGAPRPPPRAPRPLTSSRASASQRDKPAPGRSMVPEPGGPVPFPRSGAPCAAPGCPSAGGCAGRLPTPGEAGGGGGGGGGGRSPQRFPRCHAAPGWLRPPPSAIKRQFPRGSLRAATRRELGAPPAPCLLPGLSLSPAPSCCAGCLHFPLDPPDPLPSSPLPPSLAFSWAWLSPGRAGLPPPRAALPEGAGLPGPGEGAGGANSLHIAEGLLCRGWKSACKEAFCQLFESL